MNPLIFPSGVMYFPKERQSREDSQVDRKKNKIRKQRHYNLEMVEKRARKRERKTNVSVKPKRRQDWRERLSERCATDGEHRDRDGGVA